jgi:hypothetical protein
MTRITQQQLKSSLCSTKMKQLHERSEAAFTSEDRSVAILKPEGLLL